AHIGRFLLSTVAQFINRDEAALVCLRFQVRFQLFEVTGRASPEPGSDLRRQLLGDFGAEHPVQKIERLLQCGIGVWLSRLLSDINVDPSGCDRENLIVESGRTLTVERQASQKNDARHRIICNAYAGSRQVVVHESLTLKSAQQALDEAM